MFDRLFDFGDDSSTDPKRRERENNPDGLTKLTRERPNGRLVEPGPEPTEFGTDRRQTGQFASKDRDPVPLLRDHDTGRVEPDKFAVGVTSPHERAENLFEEG